ncbi:MAG: ribosomal L7Ae/L30e/S12e/Gadd45 family protein [Clostridia bacterium]|nr:ribosomal L7Ae/L30e/S12e/Gadd45 family protein [Clostridia bacterium]
MVKSEKFYRMLGLCTRAGAVAFGEGGVKDSIRGKTARLVIVADDGSDNTKKKFRNNCSFYSVPYFEHGDRFALGNATGRSFAVVLSITNKDLADSLIKVLNDSETDAL